MKNRILFKTLVDILYIFHFFGILGIIFTIPFGIVQINQANISVEDWTLLHWTFFIVSFLTYVVLLRGLYFLRKTARFLLSKNAFTDTVTINLKKSGFHILLTGILLFITTATLWTGIFLEKEILLHQNLNQNLIMPLFLIIIGMFFILQSNFLLVAKEFKEENELTV